MPISRLVAASIAFATSEKQGLLEANSLRERYERLVGLMRFKLAELSSGGGPGPGVMQYFFAFQNLLLVF